jgi:hypothetical protein
MAAALDTRFILSESEAIDLKLYPGCHGGCLSCANACSALSLAAVIAKGGRHARLATRRVDDNESQGRYFAVFARN